MNIRIPQLAFDLSETIRFLQIIAPDGNITFQTFDDDKERKDPRLCKILHGATDENFTVLSRLNQAGAGIFVMLNAGDGQGRKKKNVTGVRAIFVDLDKDGQEKRNRIEYLRTSSPRIIVESSSGKFHAYWKIEGVLPLDCFTPIQKHFATRFGGDLAVTDLPRVMRLPGFHHNKGAPFLTRIVFENPKASPLPVEVLVRKARAFSARGATVPVEHIGKVNANADFEVEASCPNLPLWLPEALKHIDAKPYKEWVEVGMALHHATNGSEAGLKIFIDWSSTAEEFNQESCNCKDTWASFGNNPGEKLTLGTIYHLAKEGGWTGPQVENLTAPHPLPDELLPVAAFDFALLPDSLRAWAQDICERVQCPPDFVGAGIMASLAAVIGRKIGIRPQAHTDWTEVPNLWALVVGRPGVLKSPALEATLAPLNRLVVKANEDHTGAYSEYKKNLAVAKLRAAASEKVARARLAKEPGADVLALLAVDEPDEPTLKRYKANDTSPASLGELLRQNSNGLLIYRDELVSLLKGLDREDQAEGRGFYLTAWNGDSPYTFDRIGRGLNLNIEAVCLSILGGTQPGRLAEYIRHAVKGGAADDGLIQRFGLLVWPDTGGAWKDVDRWPDTSAKNQAFKVFDHLDKISPATIGAEQDLDLDGNPDGIPYLRFDDDGLKVFQEWRNDLESRLRGGDLPPALESHFAKYRKLIPALALIIHLADEGTGPVTEKATTKALAWGAYLETHARRAYGVTLQPGVPTAKAILNRIKKGDLPASFSCRDVWRHGWAMLSDREQVADGLRLLVDYGHLWEKRNDETGGRPSTTFHFIDGSKQ